MMQNRKYEQSPTYLLKKLNLLSKTFPQRNLQAQMILLMSFNKDAKRININVNTNSLRK